MKQKFSTSWIGSKQVRKQRKYRHNAPLHIKHKFLSANLSKELRKKYGKRSLTLKKGDEVIVMRGKFAKKKAKISSVDLKKTRVVLENINRGKKDGTKVNVYFNPSNLQISAINLDDTKRMKKMKISEVPKSSKKEKADGEDNVGEKDKVSSRKPSEKDKTEKKSKTDKKEKGKNAPDKNKDK